MSASPSSIPAEPTHPCVRCGTPVPMDVAMCDRCNPLGLSQPASSQVHGTVALGIIVAVVVLAVAGRVALAGVGPFEASVANVATAARGLTVTLQVHNRGTSAGATTCRVFDPSGLGASAFVQSPQIEAGQTLTFSSDVLQLGSAPKSLEAECQSP